MSQDCQLLGGRVVMRRMRPGRAPVNPSAGCTTTQLLERDINTFSSSSAKRGLRDFQEQLCRKQLLAVEEEEQEAEQEEEQEEVSVLAAIFT